MKENMYSAFIDISLPVEKVPFDIGYERLESVLNALGEIHPVFESWIERLGEGEETAVHFSDRTKYLARVEKYAEMVAKENSTIPYIGGLDTDLLAARSWNKWLKLQVAELRYISWMGRMTLELFDPVDFFGETKVTGIVKDCVRAIGQHAPVVFIGTDAHAPMLNGDPGFEMYMGERQLFPHRRWLGWMGFVPHKVEPRHIPEAAELIPVGDKGTVIVAVNECFDLHNPLHIKKAHEVEARMAHIGLLDVTDKSLLD